MPTLVTVPATTGPKSQETGPDVLLMELAVWLEHTCIRLKTKTIASSPCHRVEAILAVHLSEFFDLESGVGTRSAGRIDMVFS